MEPWYKRDPDFYDSERCLIEEKFPTLYYIEEKGKVILTGIIYLDSVIEGMSIKDSYKVRIVFPDDYPASLPDVFEVGGRKEKVLEQRGLGSLVDLHYLPVIGSACLCQVRAEGRYVNRGTTIEKLLNELIIWFFYEQSYYEKTGRWPAGEYAHGDEATWEFYCDELKTKDYMIISNCLRLLLKDGYSNFDVQCPCASGKLFGICHPSIYKRLRALRPLIPPELAFKDLLFLMKRNFEKRPLLWQIIY